MIDNIEQEEIQLPKASSNRGGSSRGGLPPASKDKLLDSGHRLKRERRQKEMEEREKKKEEQIYSKNNEEKPKEEDHKVQIVYMKPNGSHIFQILMEFHQVYSILYFIIEILVFVYKAFNFKYPDDNHHIITLEIMALVFYLFIQFGRFYFGSLGNRAEASTFVLFCIIFSLGVVYSYIHYLCLQTYVLRIEVITNSVGIGLWGFEVIFGVLAFLGISGKESGI